MNTDIPCGIVAGIMLTHYFADFVFQTHYQAQNKSKCNFALFAHVNTYSWCLIPISFLCFNPIIGLLWVWINGALHFITDYVTSRMTSKRWKDQRWHDFFEVVGCDQLIHYFCLFTTYLIFKNYF